MYHTVLIGKQESKRGIELDDRNNTEVAYHDGGRKLRSVMVFHVVQSKSLIPIWASTPKTSRCIDDLQRQCGEDRSTYDMLGEAIIGESEREGRMGDGGSRWWR